MTARDWAWAAVRTLLVAIVCHLIFNDKPSDFWYTLIGAAVGTLVYCLWVGPRLYPEFYNNKDNK